MGDVAWTRKEAGVYMSRLGTIRRTTRVFWAFESLGGWCSPPWGCSTLAQAKAAAEKAWRKRQRWLRTVTP